MTEVAGSAKQVGQGLTQKTFSYEPLNALVDIITNTAGECASLNYDRCIHLHTGKAKSFKLLFRSLRRVEVQQPRHLQPQRLSRCLSARLQLHLRSSSNVIFVTSDVMAFAQELVDRNHSLLYLEPNKSSNQDRWHG